LDGWGELGSEPENIHLCKGPAVQLTSPGSATLWSRELANDKILTTRKLEAAHHRWLRKILHILWKDKVTNDKVRELAQRGILEDTNSERRLRWAGHFMRMDGELPDKLPIDARRRPS